MILYRSRVEGCDKFMWVCAVLMQERQCKGEK